MKLKQVSEILEAEVLVNKESLNLEIKMVCGANLLSDVLAFTKPGSLLLTTMTDPQVIHTAEMAEVKAVCFVQGKYPSCKTRESAEEKKLPLLCTSLFMYEACGRLYNHDLQGC